MTALKTTLKTRTKPAPPDPNDTFGITVAQREALETEVLYRLSGFDIPVTLARVFEGFEPVWAADALARCERVGRVERETRRKPSVGDVVIWRITAAGRAVIRGPRR
jgi:hypothetical protein